MRREKPDGSQSTGFSSLLGLQPWALYRPTLLHRHRKFRRSRKTLTSALSNRTRGTESQTNATGVLRTTVTKEHLRQYSRKGSRSNYLAHYRGGRRSNDKRNRRGCRSIETKEQERGRRARKREEPGRPAASASPKREGESQRGRKKRSSNDAGEDNVLFPPPSHTPRFSPSLSLFSTRKKTTLNSWHHVETQLGLPRWKWKRVNNTA